MTNNLKFVSRNYPSRIETYDNGNLTSTEILLLEDDPENKRQWYATTSREVRIIDLASDAPEVLAEKAKREEASKPKTD